MAAPTLQTAGRKGHLTTQQQDALDLLRKELIADQVFSPARHDDNTLLRFLRARRFDVPQTRQMMVSQEHWRTEYKVEEIARSFVFSEADQVRRLYPQYYHKTDKLGRPIYIEHLSKLNVKELYNVTSMERMQQKLVYEYEKTINERFVACSLAAGTHIEQSCTILDLDGVSLTSFPQVSGFVKQISKIGQDYYPELLGNMFIINSPMMFSTIWSVIKMFLDETTAAKIHILGSKYKKTLLEHVDADNLPVRLGGNCRCDDCRVADGVATTDAKKYGVCEVSDAGPWKTCDTEKIQQINADKEAENRRVMEQVQRDLEANPLPQRRSASVHKKSMDVPRSSIDKNSAHSAAADAVSPAAAAEAVKN
ncbi:cytosolic factor, phosphatidylinositol/phosphatidylcholine transfer protein [Sorochytrium milnesiophthora]